MTTPVGTAAEMPRLNLVVGGHVDHGKSTIIGRLLADTGALPEGKLAQVRARCERAGKPFEYAFLLDALHDEQAQGITIDAARVFFRTATRSCIIIDAPGHIEFLRNLVTGASRAEAALLVIDAHEGIRENSRRHGYMMAMLGIRQLVVLVNKMDLVGYAAVTFDRICSEYSAFLAQLDVVPMGFIPVSGRMGEGLARPSAEMPWYKGPTVLEALDRFAPAADGVELPFRLSVQDVYKFARQGDARRIVAGTVDAGRLRPGDPVVFYPSGKRAVVRTLEAFHRASPEEALAGEAVGFTLEEQVYVARGELAARGDEPPPQVATRLRASLFWLGTEPLVRHRDYILKIGAARTIARVETIHRVLDAASLSVDEQRTDVRRHEVAELTIETRHPIACDLAADAATTSRFVLVDDFEIRGGGIIREVLADPMSGPRDRALVRNLMWESSRIPAEERAARYHQQPLVVLVSGAIPDERKHFAKAVEARLFAQGTLVYYLGIGNVLYGVDADLERGADQRGEHIRRLAEISHLMVDAGLVLVVTAAEFSDDERQLLATALAPDTVLTVWVGDTPPERQCDLHVEDASDLAVEQVHQFLTVRGVFAAPGTHRGAPA